MGDLVKKKVSLEDKIANRERKMVKNSSPIDSFLNDANYKKDKQISVRTNSKYYEKFQKLCKEQGFSANACLNMMMYEYLKKNGEV